MNKISYTVSGMTCMGCVNSVKRVLSSLAGVANVEIALDQGKVDIDYDATKVQEPQLKTAIEEAGYQVAA